MDSLTVRRAVLLGFVVALAWSFGAYLASFVQFLLTQLVLNPLLRNLLG